MTDQIGRLPDPENAQEARYYNGVTAKRLFAWIVDSILIAVLTMILLPLTAFTALFYLPLFWLCIGLAYRILTIANGSATPGMRLAGIELRMEDGERLISRRPFSTPASIPSRWRCSLRSWCPSC